MEERPPFLPPEEDTPFLKNPLVLAGLGLVIALLIPAVALILLGSGDGDGSSSGQPKASPTVSDDVSNGDSGPRVAARILDVADVRSGPGAQYPFLGTLRSGTPVEVVGRDEDSTWLEIVFPPDSRKRGWIEADAVEVEGNLSLVRVATPSPLDLPTVPTSEGGTPTVTEEPSETVEPEETPTSEPVETPEPGDGELPDLVIGIPVSIVGEQVVVTAINQGIYEYRGNITVSLYDESGAELLASSNSGIVALQPGAAFDVAVPYTPGAEAQEVIVVLTGDQPETDTDNNSARVTLPASN